jgi:hypothetical protein
MHFAGKCIDQNQVIPALTMPVHRQDGLTLALGVAAPAFQVRRNTSI